MALTVKQQKFIEFYDGNGTDAARKAGYKGSDGVVGVTAFNLLRNPKIRKELDSRNKNKTSRIIASREERQEFWTKTMNNPNVDMRDRLKASELLGRSESDFMEKIEHSGAITLEILLCGKKEAE